MSDSQFWIRRISFHGDDVHPVSVTFKPGFNVIHGPSDSGKTYLAESLRYMLSGGKHPFPSHTGYTNITLELATPAGVMTLLRRLGEQRVTVSAPCFGLDSSPVLVDKKSITGQTTTLSDFLLKSLGLTEPRTVITSKYGQRQKLAWRHFIHVLYRSEQQVAAASSIFSSEKVTTLSSFLTLLFDHDLSDVAEHPTPSEAKLERAARLEELDRLIDATYAKLDSLDDNDTSSSEECADDINHLLNSLAELTEESNRRAEELAVLHAQIRELEESITQAEVSLLQYEELGTIYLQDIDRLNSVVEAESLITNVPRPTSCPYCDSPLPEQQVQSYRSAASREGQAIAYRLQDLTDLRDQTRKEARQFSEQLVQTRQQFQDATDALDMSLRPKIRDIRQDLANHEASIGNAHRRRFLQEQIAQLLHERSTISEENDEPEPFDPTARFPDEFFQEMSLHLESILTEIHFEGANQARFDRKDFDLCIGETRKGSHGQGMRAFFNTVVLLSLQKYIAERAIYRPAPIIIDTPTLGLEHYGESEQFVISRDARSARPSAGLLKDLFNYMKKAGKYGQIIVLNNTDMTPNIPFDGPNSSELIFGRGPQDSRPGLLHLDGPSGSSPSPEDLSDMGTLF